VRKETKSFSKKEEEKMVRKKKQNTGGRGRDENEPFIFK